MKKIIASIILLLTLNTGFAQVRQQQINIQCYPTDYVFNTLKEKFGETIKSISKFRGFTITHWENDEKASMTITITTPTGEESCMLINGENVIKVIGKLVSL